MKVLGEKIIVKRVVKTKTESGLVLPIVEDKPVMNGEVTGVGNNMPDWCDVKVGDIVVWMAYGGTEFEVNGDKLLVIRPNDIVGILEPESKIVGLN